MALNNNGGQQPKTEPKKGRKPILDNDLLELKRKLSKDDYKLVIMAWTFALRHREARAMKRRNVRATAFGLQFSVNDPKIKTYGPQTVTLPWKWVPKEMKEVLEHWPENISSPDVLNCKIWEAKGPGFCFHCLRHGRATYFARANMPMLDLMRFCRWRSIASALRYLHA